MTARYYAGGLSGGLAAANGGSLVFYSGTMPTPGTSLSGFTVLATLPMAATAFGTPTGTPPVATAGAITTANASSTGTASFAAILGSGGAPVLICSVGTSGADINMSTISFVSGSPVSVSALTVTA